MALYQKYNNEEILSRAVIAGLLNILNNKITYEQVWSNEQVETIEVPWYYNMSGDERFMQDFFTHYGDCEAPRPADGNFDFFPRGIITYTGTVIDAQRITSRYVQGLYLKDVEGQLQTMRSFLYSIPLNINFDCELWADTQITALKIEQAIRETFYKTVTFYVYYRGMRVGCTVGFPEDITLNKNIQYSFETNNSTRIKINFTLQVETYQPVFDPTTEVNANSFMTGVGLRIIDKNVANNDGSIGITSPQDGAEFEHLVVPKGAPLMIEWNYTQENAIINKIDAYWADHGTNDLKLIEKGVPNHQYYIWNIPETFTTYTHPELIYSEDASISIYRKPAIRILPDICTGEITAGSFYVFDPGYFIAPSSDTSINLVLEMTDSLGNVTYSGDASIRINIRGYKVNEDNPVTIDGSVYFPGTIDYKLIDLYIANSVNTNIFDVVQYIRII